MVATYYDEAVMGTVAFMIGFDSGQTPRSTIVQLIDGIIKDVNEKNEVLKGENFEIHFHLDNIEDEVWYELNGLVKLAYERRNKEMSPIRVVHSYLTSDELDRFSTLTDRLSEGAPL